MFVFLKGYNFLNSGFLSVFVLFTTYNILLGDGADFVKSKQGLIGTLTKWYSVTVTGPACRMEERAVFGECWWLPLIGLNNKVSGVYVHVEASILRLMVAMGAKTTPSWFILSNLDGEYKWIHSLL